MTYLIRMLILLLLTSVAHGQAGGSVIEVEINNIDNSKGQILIALFDSESSWLKKPYQGSFGKILDGKSTVEFRNIGDGTYAISVFHDEDNDGELDTNFFGIPSEAIGSSNDAPARFGPPKWKDAKFEIKGGDVRQIINL
jgi:uncharacterized protein (DUF2141 family)